MSEISARKNWMGRREFAALLPAILILAISSPAANTPDARKIVEDVLQQDKSHDMTMRAVLDIVDKDGHSLRKKFTLSKIGTAGDSKTLLRFTDPQEIRGVALLSIDQTGTAERQWLYTPAIERVRPIQPRERSERFAGSDFTYEDIGERTLDDFTYKMISDNEMMDGHKTFKIEATPVAADRSQYKFIYFWVAQDVPCILNAEMYDQQGRKIRVLHASQLKKVSGMWGARKLEMISPLENTRTALTIEEVRFNTGLNEKLFTPEALEQGHSS